MNLVLRTLLLSLLLLILVVAGIDNPFHAAVAAAFQSSRTRAVVKQCQYHSLPQDAINIPSHSSRLYLAESSSSNDNNDNDKHSNNGDDDLLAELPMIRLKLPQRGVGREYIAVQLVIDGRGPFDFMVDTGLTTEMITPHLQQLLHLPPSAVDSFSDSDDDSRDDGIKGVAAGGNTQIQFAQLSKAELVCSSGSGTSRLPLPSPLPAIVADFPQEHIDPLHDPVEGMIGMDVLLQYDTDFDFPNQCLRLWKPQTAAAAAATKHDEHNMVEIPAAIINESLLEAIRITSTQAPNSQPILGLIDCGASFSCVNRAGAPLLGLPTDSKAYQNDPINMAVGVDGRPLYLPMKPVQFTFVGNPESTASAGPNDDNNIPRFEAPPAFWRPWDPVLVGVGDLPVFSQILGDGITPYQGPAVLLGLDVLAQRRVILETNPNMVKRRRVWVSPN